MGVCVCVCVCVLWWAAHSCCASMHFLAPDQNHIWRLCRGGGGGWPLHRGSECFIHITALITGIKTGNSPQMKRRKADGTPKKAWAPEEEHQRRPEHLTMRGTKGSLSVTAHTVPCLSSFGSSLLLSRPVMLKQAKDKSIICGGVQYFWRFFFLSGNKLRNLNHSPPDKISRTQVKRLHEELQIQKKTESLRHLRNKQQKTR